MRRQWCDLEHSDIACIVVMHVGWLIDVGEAAEILRGGISKPINTKRDAQVRDGDAIDKYDV